jgi:hypothetical protein
MAVFTTRSLLHALGVSRRGATSSAVAVNWVIKVGPMFLPNSLSCYLFHIFWRTPECFKFQLINCSILMFQFVP